MRCEEIRSKNDIYLLPFLPLAVDGLSNQIVDEVFDELQVYGTIELLDVSVVFAMLAYEHYDGDMQWLHRGIRMIDDLAKLRLLQGF